MTRATRHALVLAATLLSAAVVLAAVRGNAEALERMRNSSIRMGALCQENMFYYRKDSVAMHDFLSREPLCVFALEPAQ